jgi:hypothetical protein
MPFQFTRALPRSCKALSGMGIKEDGLPGLAFGKASVYALSDHVAP